MPKHGMNMPQLSYARPSVRVKRPMRLFGNTQQPSSPERASAKSGQTAIRLTFAGTLARGQRKTARESLISSATSSVVTAPSAHVVSTVTFAACKVGGTAATAAHAIPKR